MRKVVSGIMLALLFLASLTPMFSVQLVNAEEELPIVWEAVYDEGKSEFFSNVAVDSNGNLIVVGNVIDYSTGEAAGIIAKYSGGGELLWLEKVQPYSFTNLNGIAVDSNSNIIVFGVTSTNPDMQDYGGSQIAEWLIAKFYPNGTLMWQTYYRKEGMGYHREGMYGIVAYDDNIICTGVAGYQFRVIKLDINGSLLWETQPSIGAQGNGMAIDKNGDILVVGQTRLYPSSDVVLVKLSQSGSELWVKVFDWGGNEVGRDIDIDWDGNIIIIGGAPLFVLKLNSAGDTIWRKEYPRTGYECCNLHVWPNRYGISTFSSSGASPPYYVEYDVDGKMVNEVSFRGGSISVDKQGRLTSAHRIGTWPDVNATLTVYHYPAPHDLAVSLDAPSFLELSNTALLNATVHNIGLNNETNVELQLLINDTVVSSILIPELLTEESYTLSYSWAPSVVGVYNVTAYTAPVPGENITANNLKTGFIRVLILPEILIVNDDDGASWIRGTSLQEFESALSSLGYDYWVWNESSEGNPPLDFLVKFKLVIWTCGDFWNWAVDPFDAAILQSYLAQGGNILLEGEDIGYNHDADEFMVNVAHAIYQVDNTGAPGLTVTDPTHPVTFNLPTSLTWLIDPPYDDGVTPTNGGAEVIRYTGTTWTAVTVFGENVGGKVVYYAFPLYCLPEPHRTTLAVNSINWLLGIRYEHELSVKLEAPDILQLGKTAVLNATIYNYGLKNESDVKLQLLINNTEVYSVVIPELLSGSFYTFSYLWTPTVGGTYNITAYVPPVFGENVTTNNFATKTCVVIEVLPVAKEIIYDEGLAEYFHNAVIDGRGNIVVVGAVYEASTGKQWILVVKYSPDGAILWSKKLNPYYRTMPGTVAIDSNDNIVVFTATSTNADFQDYGGDQIAEWMIVKFTTDGEMLWQSFYRKEGMGYHREGGWGIATYNGQIFATGCAGYGFWVISLDSNGTLLWQKQLGSYGAHGQGIAVDKNGDILVVGQTYIYPPSDVLLAKLSQSGDIIWSKILDWGGNEGGREIAVDADNNIVFVGEGNPPFIAKVNTIGELIWKREYLRVNIDRAYHLQVWPHQYAISVFSDAGQSPPYYVEYNYQGNMVFEAIFNGGSLSNDKYGRLISASMVGVWPTNTNATLTVYNYPPYQLTITSTIGGTTNPDPATYHYHNGDSANVTAIPYIGYSFNYWLLDGNMRTENPITVMMDSNHTLEAYFVDDIPPEISEPWQDPRPDNVQPFQNVTVWVNVTDYGAGVKNVTLWYSIDNGASWTILNMTALPIPSDTWITYEATIDGYGNCTWVTYKIIAYDNAGNNATKDNNGYGYQYHVIPEYPSALMLIMLMLTTLIATIPLKKRRTKNNFLNSEGLI